MLQWWLPLLRVQLLQMLRLTPPQHQHLMPPPGLGWWQEQQLQLQPPPRLPLLQQLQQLLPSVHLRCCLL